MAKRRQPSLTVDEAFQRFCRQEKAEPHVACESFNEALRERRIRLQCDGGPPDGVSADFIASHLRVTVEKQSDGWTAKITALRALEQPVEEYEWTVLAAGVNSLLKSESGRKRGRKPKFDWPTIEREITQRCIDKKTKMVTVPDNISKFTKAMLDWCDTTFEEAPEERSVRAAVTRIFDLLRE